MRYQCVQCNEEFTVDDDAERPRCPKCMRQHGLRKVQAAKPAAGRGAGRAGWILPLASALGLLAAAGGYLYFQRAQGSGERAAAAEVRALGVEAGELSQLLLADEQVTRFAEQAAGSAGSSQEKAKAIVAAFTARAQKQAFVRGSLAEPRGTAPMTAEQTAEALRKDGAHLELYPLEAAALAVAALRALDVPASLVEVYRYEGARAPLDPSGRFGYHAVALTKPDGATPELFDPFGGRSVAPKPGDYAVLTDAQALAAALSLRALHRLSNLGEPTPALADVDAAVKLAPASPSVRSARGAVMIASGGAEAGARELEAAAQLRSDAARHNNLAVLALAQGDAERAQKEVALALAEAPDFALAQLTLASVHMARLERDLARAALEKAQALEPNLAAVALAWAELHASNGELPEALAKAELGVRLRPKNPETHLVLGRVYRQAGRYDEMRAEARKVLELSTVSDKERVKKLLQNVLGPTALEPPSEPVAEDEPASPRAGASEPGSLKLGSSEPKLRLGGGDDKLKLELDP